MRIFKVTHYNNESGQYFDEYFSDVHMAARRFETLETAAEKSKVGEGVEDVNFCMVLVITPRN